MVKNFTDKDYGMFILLFLIILSISSIVSSVLNVSTSFYFNVDTFPIAIGIFIARDYMGQVKLTKKYLSASIISCIIFTVILVLTMHTSCLQTGKMSMAFDSWNLITTVVPSLSIFYMMRYFFETKKMKTRSSKLIELISLQTFGIYLFHCSINYKIYFSSKMLNIFAINGYLGIFTLEIMYFVIC